MSESKRNAQHFDDGFSDDDEDNGATTNEFDPNEFDDDDDDEFDDSYNASEGGRGGGESKVDLNTKKVSNDHFDEAMELDASLSGDSVDTNEAGTPKMRRAESDRGDSPPNTGNARLDREIGGGLSDSEDMSSFRDSAHEDAGARVAESKTSQQGAQSPTGDSDAAPVASQRRYTGKLNEMDHSFKQSTSALKSPIGSESGASDSDEESTNTSNAGDSGIAPIKGGYNPSDFAHLNVSEEVRELFQYIGRYKPHNIELDSKLRTFVPDYIPSVGAIDAFIKVPRPDIMPDNLGLKVLDEPTSNQSDPTVLDLQLRAISKKSNLEPMVVRSIENADKNPKAVAGWIKSIKELHRSKPPPQVNYTKSMPDIESLMQVWPEEVEHMLREVNLPAAEIDLDLKDYARVVCAILDIPVFHSMTESLHVLFTLYSEFRNNQHFRNNVGDDMVGGGLGVRGQGLASRGESRETAGDGFDREFEMKM